MAAALHTFVYLADKPRYKAEPWYVRLFNGTVVEHHYFKTEAEAREFEARLRVEKA
jgi:hypothetical protein